MKRGRLVREFILYVVLDVACTGIGMGVPILSILLGLVVGWRIVSLLGLASRPVGDALAEMLVWVGITCGVTFVVMAAIWGQVSPDALRSIG
jgi:hypothetical protein